MASEVMDLDEKIEAGDGSNASVGFYSFVAVVLCPITAVEVAILYPPLQYMPDSFRVAVLISLSVIKFVSVVAFFMHLYYDHPITTALFSTGMILAAGTMVGLIHVIPQAENPLKPDLRKNPTKAEVKHEETQAPFDFQQRLSQWRQIQVG